VGAARITARAVQSRLRRGAPIVIPTGALVVGGGPAGATAAIALARAGWSVALVEKSPFPRRKVCGEYISATTWPVLRELGVAGSIAGRVGPAVLRVGLFSEDTAIDAPMPAARSENGEWGHAIGRDILDSALLAEAARAGAVLWQPWAVNAVRREGGGYVATLRQAHGTQSCEIRSRIVVDAHGSWERSPFSCDARPASRARDLFGFKARFRGARLPQGLMPLLLFAGGYGGMVHTDGADVSFSCCIRRDALRRQRGHAALGAGDAVIAHVERHCRAAREVLAGAHRMGPWLSAGPIRPGIRALAADGVFAVGNAAGEAHPLVAEGISMAIQSAWILASVLAPHGGIELTRAQLDSLGRDYAARWKAHLAARIRVAAVLAAFMARPAGARASAIAVAKLPRLLSWGARWSGKARMLAGA
jgi:flavin-dependent dehydrogenase